MKKRRDEMAAPGRGRFNYALLLPVAGSLLLAGALLAFSGSPDVPPPAPPQARHASAAPTRALHLPPPGSEVRHAPVLRGRAEPDAVMPPKTAAAQVYAAAPVRPPGFQPPGFQAAGFQIAIVIDDCGPSEAGTKAAIALPAGITLSFLPYSPDSPVLSHRAYLAGHEVILHLPMQPKGTENPGPQALVTGLAPDELQRRLEWSLARVSDFDGVNNHMGSKFTASRADLVPVMQTLAAHRLFFLDSRTTPDSQAQSVAREAGMLTGTRDVFLDDVSEVAAVEHQLMVAETHARNHGSVIAIGHPHPATLAALTQWIAGVEARGFTLVPLRAVLERRARRDDLRASAADAR